MKSIKLTLAALMLTAAFTACTKEEFAPTQEIQKDEFVGAKLIGSGLSVNIQKEGETRVDANGNWAKGDEAGLGWVVSGQHNSDQSENVAPTNAAPFANHLFVNMEGGDSFSTYGNVYEGWHFGYYPYQYMPKVGVDMNVDINPKQEDTYDNDQYVNRLHLSARQFLTADENLSETGRELVNTNLNLRRAVKTIKVTVKPASDLQADALKALKITGIKLAMAEGVTYKPFYSGEVALELNKLAAIVKDPGTDLYNEENTAEAFYDALPQVWANAVASNSIETVVNKAGINLTGDQVLRIYTLPYMSKTAKNGHVTEKNTEFVISTQAGEFTVKYTPKNDPDFVESIHGVNNATFEKLAAAYQNDGETVGYLRGWEIEKDRPKATLALDLVLSAEMFQTDFDDICSESEWNNAVAMVNALGMDEVTFKIKKTRNSVEANRKLWSFVDIDGDGNLVNLPDNAVLTVSDESEDMILGAVGSWPITENLVINTNLQVRNNLTVEGVLNVEQGKTIYNGATITAGANAEIGTRFIDKSGAPISGVSATFKNMLPAGLAQYGTRTGSTGTVKVQTYGAYVYPASGDEGTIAYEVNNADITEIRKINRLLGEDNDKGSANVNTLIVKTVLDLNARAVEGLTGDDRYEEIITEQQVLANLWDKNISVRLAGGSLVHRLSGLNTSVKNITAISGVNTIDDVIAKNITVNSGATLNVNNSKTTLAKTYFTEGRLTNSGILNLNNVRLDVTGDITNNANASINVTSGSAINYHAKYTQNGSSSGTIKPGYAANILVSTLNELTSAISLAKANSTITTVELSGDVTLTDANMNLDGLVLDGHGYVVKTNNTVAAGNGKGVFTLNKGTIKNVKFSAPNTQYDVVITGSDNVTIDNCSFDTPTATAMGKGKRALYINNYTGSLTVKNAHFDDKVYAFNLANSSTATLNFANCNLNGWMSGAAKFNFEDCVFGKSGDYADFVCYDTANFEGCTFNAGFKVSLKFAKTLTFDDSCTMGSKAISAPHDVKWSYNGGTDTDGHDSQNVTVVVDEDTWETTATKAAVENSTLTWSKK